MEYGRKSWDFLKKWGPIGVVTHYTISLTILGVIYAAVHSRRDDIMPYIPSYIPQSGTNLVISMALHKLTLPVRLPLTVACVPTVYRTASKLGIPQFIDNVAAKMGISAVATVAEEASKKTE